MKPPLRLPTAILLALALTACAATEQAAPADGTPIALSPATEGELASYLRKVKVTRPGAFAISIDGRDSFYTWCDNVACVIANYSIPALRGCRSLSGKECVVLYVRDEPRRAFTRAEAGSDSTGRHGSQQQMEYDFDQDKN